MAKDFYHNHVKTALEKDGWKIAAEKGGKKIAVEIKSFLSRSTISEFHRAVGQFVDYYAALELHEPKRILYLAVPEETYNSFFTKRVIQTHKC